MVLAKYHIMLYKEKDNLHKNANISKKSKKEKFIKVYI